MKKYLNDKDMHFSTIIKLKENVFVNCINISIFQMKISVTFINLNKNLLNEILYVNKRSGSFFKFKFGLI